jgi:hypothetical protein
MTCLTLTEHYTPTFVMHRNLVNCVGIFITQDLCSEYLHNCLSESMLHQLWTAAKDVQAHIFQHPVTKAIPLGCINRFKFMHSSNSMWTKLYYFRCVRSSAYRHISLCDNFLEIFKDQYVTAPKRLQASHMWALFSWNVMFYEAPSLLSTTSLNLDTRFCRQEESFPALHLSSLSYVCFSIKYSLFSSLYHWL